MFSTGNWITFTATHGIVQRDVSVDMKIGFGPLFLPSKVKACMVYLGPFSLPYCYKGERDIDCMVTEICAGSCFLLVRNQKIF